MAHNDHSSIIIAAGSITMSGKQLLPVVEISEAELDVVRTNAWVSLGFRGQSVATASEAAALLGVGGPGLAVIAGVPGFGKRTAGIRALWEAAQAEKSDEGIVPALTEIHPDWSDTSAPDLSLLPEEPGTGYLLDLTSEIAEWKSPHKIAVGLAGHAHALGVMNTPVGRPGGGEGAFGDNASSRRQGRGASVVGEPAHGKTAARLYRRRSGGLFDH
ncbi:hypothetical protein [Streptomyces sp. NPDC058629]|uniref:hypothetical protein n=1 Tax=Streptomyces sp. NPDC058629 TaxID=3346565 RepID=UPI003662E05B